MTTTLGMFGQNWEVGGIPDLLEKLAQHADPSWNPLVLSKPPVHSFFVTHCDFGQVEITSAALARAIETMFRELSSLALLFTECTPYREIINFVHTGDASEISDADTIGELLETCAKAAHDYWLSQRDGAVAP